MFTASRKKDQGEIHAAGERNEGAIEKAEGNQTDSSEVQEPAGDVARRGQEEDDEVADWHLWQASGLSFDAGEAKRVSHARRRRKDFTAEDAERGEPFEAQGK